MLRKAASPEARRAWWCQQIAAEEAARTGFHILALGLIAGAVVVYAGDFRPPAIASIAVALAALFGASLSAKSPRRGLVLLTLGAFVLGTGLAAFELERTRTTIFSGEATVHILGTVIAREKDERERMRYVVEIAKTERPVLSRPPEKVRIVVASRHEAIGIGGTFDGLVRLRPPSGPAAPGAYDFAFGPYFDGLGAYGFSLGAPADAANARATEHSDLGLFSQAHAAVATIRTAMTDRIRSTIDGAAGGVAAALVTGERAGIPEDVEEWLRTTGLAHVLSISGLHMAIVAGFAMLLTRAILASVPSIALRWPIKKIAAMIAFFVASLYLALSGGNVATERSFIMLAVMLIAILADRAALTLRNVSIAAVLIIIATPHAVMTASFQMSFAATVALVGGYRWFDDLRPERDRSRSVWQGAFAALVATAATSLLAGAATAPYSAYHFGRLAAFGLVANVATMPLFSFWIMPLALIGCLLMPLGLDQLPFVLMGWGLEIVLQIAEVLAAALPDFATGQIRGLALLVLTLSILAAALLQSALRFTAIPFLAGGLLIAALPGRTPDMLIFENGKEIALIDDAGRLRFLRDRPNAFVAEQWERMFPQPNIAGEEARGRIDTDCESGFCTFVTRSGIRIAWTDDWKRTGEACDAGDVAIVARAIRLTECRSGAILATLRTLRRSGSLAVSRTAEGKIQALPSIHSEPNEWNRHRLAPWPEYWRPPAAIEEDGESAPTDGKSTADSGSASKSLTAQASPSLQD